MTFFLGFYLVIYLYRAYKAYNVFKLKNHRKERNSTILWHNRCVALLILLLFIIDVVDGGIWLYTAIIYLFARIRLKHLDDESRSTANYEHQYKLMAYLLILLITIHLVGVVLVVYLLWAVLV